MRIKSVYSGLVFQIMKLVNSHLSSILVVLVHSTNTTEPGHPSNVCNNLEIYFLSGHTTRLTGVEELTRFQKTNVLPKLLREII